jgi:hypothetical protein
MMQASAKVISIYDAMDSHEEPQRTHSESHADFSAEHRLTIRNALAGAEARYFTAGIPLLFPTNRVRDLAFGKEEDLETYFRVTCSAIPTVALQSYLEDLDELETVSKKMSEPILPEISLFERYGMAITVMILGAMAWGTFAHLSGAHTLFAWLSGGLAGMFLGLIFLPFTYDAHRRKSFGWILEREIMRRSGIDPDGGNTFQICPTANG